MTATATAGAATTSAPHEPELSGRALRAAAARSEQLYAQHHRMVSGLCRALLRDRTEAEDAVQQVFLSAHRSLLNGTEPREAPAWLATIARNECWARISGRMREPLPSAAADDVAGAADPVAEAIRRADLAALWRAIRALPKQQREALLLREFGGLRYDELAVALSVTEPAVESLLFRARTRLRAQLETAAAALAPFARLLASGGAPAVAAKAVAIGIGTAAVTGTAVVAPEMLEHSKHGVHSKPPAVHTVATATDIAPVALLQTPSVVPHEVKHVVETSSRRGHDRAGDDTGVSVERHDGGRDTEHSHDGTTATSATSGDGHGDRDSGSGPGPGPGPSTGSPSGSESESGSGDGDRRGRSTTTTTTTEPTTTTTSSGDGDQVRLPTLTAPTTVDLSGDGGGDGSGGGSDGGSGGGSDGGSGGGSDGPGG